MNRKETTQFLSNLLESTRLNKMGSHYAKEVTVDYGTRHSKRVDYIQFEPSNQMSVSGIEKGIFTCYEIKSCKEDVFSGNGLNFLGEKNYIVTTMQCYKDLQEDMREGKLYKHIIDTNPESSSHYGILVATPYLMPNTADGKYQEYENPTSIDSDIRWQLTTMIPCYQGGRTRSMTELLFLMLRSGK